MNWDYAKHYASFHPDTPEHWRQMSERLRRWLGPHLPTDRAAPVLDLGCGHGYALAVLRELGFAQIEGIDADAGQAAYAQAHGLPVGHVTDTVAWLAARRQYFGLVLLMDVLEHVPRTAQPDFLLAIASSLRPGGRLIITTPNAAAGLAGYWGYNDYTHHVSFTPASLGFLLSHAGFGRIHCQEIELAPPDWTPRAFVQRFFRAWRRLEYMAEFGRREGRCVPLSLNLLAVAHKD
ncbi:MAG TPA: class I SAM-dependent methyltransferase [Opitutaceae bacterium]|nr:class I SAM-dependent methyltransferase [Opitutaceae bacterium]